MPMLWGRDNVTSFQDTVHPGYGTFVLGPNEPDQIHQSNMSPSEAYGIWMEYINPLAAQGYTLISPACTDNDNSFTWYQTFFNLCYAPGSGCIVNMLAFHSYNTDPQHLITYANKFHDAFGLDVIISEFADEDYNNGPQADQDALWNYAGTVKDFVNNTPWIKMAFPFGLVAPSDLGNADINVNALNGLIDWSGNPTPLAEFYFNP
ncbi:hypothetical protein EV363DRAFT_1251607 [Boletus edulis]|uniref:Asl1-like glycosyl hydrolase catalytic domain-containing protein n=1 Tax=Boletus edulis BED1 TaxID=1328754 RepID=A0AAD4C713_BOLED|nr:hypothetical protein EV363DRAFT_1251607 [Boletus edulis]KAF8450820.1 hypothetical protein L210DRAFT_3470126 [Boletus edulis BED1]